MKKSDLVKIVTPIIEEKIEDLFLEEVVDVIADIVEKKLTVMLSEIANAASPKKTLKERLINKADVGSAEEYRRHLQNLNNPGTTPGHPGGILREHEENIDEISANPTDYDSQDHLIEALAGADYDDDVLGL
jgi:hypothetical protein